MVCLVHTPFIYNKIKVKFVVVILVPTVARNKELNAVL